MDRGDPAVAEMIDLARTALSLDANNPEVLLAAAQITALPGGDPTGGLALINKAIALNPNDASGMTAAAYLHAYAGDTGTALAYLERADRLNPLNRTPFFYFVHALAHFVAGEHEAVVEWTTKALQERFNYAAALRYRAASLGLLAEEWSVALHAVCQRPCDIGAARDRIIGRVADVTDGRSIRPQCKWVSRALCDRVAHGRNGPQICDYRREVAV
jgi:tetratricopeptide (TPR) repeat protein